MLLCHFQLNVNAVIRLLSGCELCGKIARLLPVMQKQSKSLAIIFGLSVLTALLVPLAPLPLKLLVDVVFTTEQATVSNTLVDWVHRFAESKVAIIWLAGTGSILLFLASAGLGAGSTWMWSRVGQQMTYHMAQITFDKVGRLNPFYQSRFATGDLISRTTFDNYSVFVVTQSLLIGPPTALATMIFTAVIAWQLDHLLTIVCVVAIPAVALIARLFGDLLRSRSRSERDSRSNLLSFVHQSLTSIPIVQAFDKRVENKREFERIADLAVVQTRRNVLAGGLYTLLNGFTLTFAAALVLLIGGWKVLDGQLSIGSLLVFLAYSQSMQQVTESLCNSYAALKGAEAGLDRIGEVLDTAPSVSERIDAIELVAQSGTQGLSIEFDDIGFSYDSGAIVLDGIDLTVKAGETVALVGSSGSGKSTLASLLLRFYDPHQGRILVDGIDARDYTLVSLRAAISVVMQEPFLLPMSVSENIAFARPEASHTEIVEAARLANADDFISQLADGYDTEIGEHGASLSGGQRQRIAIARALLKDSPILLMDEPTSALDVKTENQLLEALETLRKGRTTLIIAHRLSTIRDADRIAVLDNGLLVETGSHEQLMAACGHYHQLWHTSLAETAADLEEFDAV